MTTFSLLLSRGVEAPGSDLALALGTAPEVWLLGIEHTGHLVFFCYFQGGSGR